MTLAELLALIPDNDTGAIDADDLRTIVTGLYNQPKLSFFTRWSYQATPASLPANQNVSFQAADPGASTYANFSLTSKDSLDMGGALLRLQLGARIHFQDANDDTRWMRSEVSAAPSALAGPPAGVQIPIVKIASGITTGWTGDVLVLFGLVPL